MRERERERERERKCERGNRVAMKFEMLTMAWQARAESKYSSEEGCGKKE